MTSPYQFLVETSNYLNLTYTEVMICFGVASALYVWKNYGDGGIMNYLISDDTKENACERLGIEKKKFNIAFIGRGSTGRTSLIEGITRGEGRVETREHGRKYVTPHFNNCRFWDISKFDQFDAVQYYNQNFLFHFDLIVVVCQETLGTDEAKLISEAKTRNLPVILVRSKCDIDLQNDKYFGKILEVNQEAANYHMKDLSTKFEIHLNECGLNGIPVFFVSAPVLKNIALRAKLYYQEKQFLEFLINAADKKHSEDE